MLVLQLLVFGLETEGKVCLLRTPKRAPQTHGPDVGFVLYGSLSAQAADRALNSSESFSLGGATGVRSYPNGEAQGTGGLLAQFELRYEIGAVTPYLFYDQGDIFARDGQPSRSLGGVGLGARYRAGSLSAEAACAWKTNGGAATSDSKQQDPRLWLSMGYRY